MSADLLPCPFCGGKARPLTQQDLDWPGKQFVSIGCGDCGAETANVFGTGDPSEWAEARDNWNRRAASSEASRPQAGASVAEQLGQPDSKKTPYSTQTNPNQFSGDPVSGSGRPTDEEGKV